MFDHDGQRVAGWRARDVKARKIDAGGVFDAPIFRAHGRGSLLEDRKSQS